MERRARVISSSVFAGLASIVVGASLTWACTGPDFGTPATPGNPPSPSPEASAPQPAPTTQAQGGAPAAAPVGVSPSTGTSGSGVTSGARGAVTNRAPATNRGSAPARAPVSVGVAPGRSSAPSTAVANSQFAQRSNGATAGVTARGGQTVFASPAAKARATSKSKSRATPSARSAAGDLWAGMKPAARSSVFAAEASAAKQAGGAPMTAALVVLGLGVVGLAGTASVLGLRRRRAAASATGSGSSSSGTTEM